MNIGGLGLMDAYKAEKAFSGCGMRILLSESTKHLLSNCSKKFVNIKMNTNTNGGWALIQLLQNSKDRQ